jgi:pyridoxine 4-dehydrogenase
VTTSSIAHESGTFAIGGDLTVNRLGYGAMRLTGKGVWGPPADHDECIRVLRRAVELGVNFIDTANSYGPYVSEELIHEALHPYAEGLVIATKAGLVRTGPDEWPVLGFPPYLRQECELSLRRLGVDRIDLFQLHRIDDKFPLEDQLGELVALQQEGKIRHIGLSEVSVEQLAAAQKVTTIVSVQNMYNLTVVGVRRAAAAHRRGPSRHSVAAGARVAAEAFPGGPADPWHVERRSLGGERGRRRHHAVGRGVRHVEQSRCGRLNVRAIR